ncbi:hypothetical protein [Klebsiella aerogenes]|uniref:Secreted protein n=2 Tax=Enterobacterales TaxID=91347 RepID=A0A483K5C0_9ENTR|nr:Uncharacterised protein [Klebsiella pneumoniae]SXT34624.1 Uncharacterised protein [Klebsiella pneumoniae]VGH95446.1 Uncharacterised protein [Klebsiella pneumoniae]VTN32317.1 Uncharacterised protein [Klebsiella pneumoniae]HBY1770567.1 hypothetical protein [Klebsiella pneumoniae]
MNIRLVGKLSAWAVLLMSFNVFAVSPAPRFSDETLSMQQQKAIGQVAAQYLSSHPDVLLSVLEKLCTEERMKMQCGKNINNAAISHYPDSPVGHQDDGVCHACLLAKN